MSMLIIQLVYYLFLYLLILKEFCITVLLLSVTFVLFIKSTELKMYLHICCLYYVEVWIGHTGAQLHYKVLEEVLRYFTTVKVALPQFK